jgi:hypothetical protein
MKWQSKHGIFLGDVGTTTLAAIVSPSSAVNVLK